MISSSDRHARHEHYAESGGHRSGQRRARVGRRGPAGVGAARYAPTAPMAYDENLTDRLRELLADEASITETKMFGGLAFLLHGNTAVSASRSGGLLIRIDPADTDAALSCPHVALMERVGARWPGGSLSGRRGLRTEAQGEGSGSREDRPAPEDDERSIATAIRKPRPGRRAGCALGDARRAVPTRSK
jgi:hypothetical protein